MAGLTCSRLLLVAVMAVATAAATARDRRAAPPIKPVNLASPEVPAWVTRPGRLIDVGGYRLNLYCHGRGGPTILFFAGGGWGAAGFANIQPALARHGRVCSYDRAGQGFSDLGPLEPSVDQPVRDAVSLMARAGEAGPLILVGWSLGGMEARQFATDHPDLVAGLVTIDGSSFDEIPLTGKEDWYQRSVTMLLDCQRDARAGVLAKDETRRRACARMINPLDRVPAMRAAIGDRVIDPDVYALNLYTFQHNGARASRLREGRRAFGDIPLRVLLASDHIVVPAGKPPLASADAMPNASFVKFAINVAAMSSDGHVVVIPGTSHPIHFDRPDQVVAVIEDVRLRARTRRDR